MRSIYAENPSLFRRVPTGVGLSQVCRSRPIGLLMFLSSLFSIELQIAPVDSYIIYLFKTLINAGAILHLPRFRCRKAFRVHVRLVLRFL